MVESKLVHIHDEGTHYIVCVTKFDKSDTKALERAGWRVTDTLTLITEIGNKARSTMSTFQVPEYDIPERTGTMRVSGTTLKMTKQFSQMDIKDIPNHWDVRNGGHPFIKG